MALRRVLALAVLLPMMGPSLRFLADFARPDVHACAEGMCQCAHGRPAAPPSCHDRSGTAGDCRLSARCNHAAAALPGTLPPALIPDVRTMGAPGNLAAAPVPPAWAVRTGYFRIDGPPPRTT